MVAKKDDAAKAKPEDAAAKDDATSSSSKAKAAKAKPKPIAPEIVIRGAVVLVERASRTREQRYVREAIRVVSRARATLTKPTLTCLLDWFVPEEARSSGSPPPTPGFGPQQAPTAGGAGADEPALAASARHMRAKSNAVFAVESSHDYISKEDIAKLRKYLAERIARLPEPPIPEVVMADASEDDAKAKAELASLKEAKESAARLAASAKALGKLSQKQKDKKQKDALAGDDDDGAAAASTDDKKKPDDEPVEEVDTFEPRVRVLVEVEMFFRWMLIVALLDAKDDDTTAAAPASAAASSPLAPASSKLAVHAFQSANDAEIRLHEFNRRTLDWISARLLHYWGLGHIRAGTLATRRPALLGLHRTACLHHDEPGQAVLTNLILRSYMVQKLYSQADKFRRHAARFSERDPFQAARYHLYCGQIHAVLLHYGDALRSLQQALRKAPQAGEGAAGFRQTGSKWLVIVQLLLGDIPERLLFEDKYLRLPLRAYFALTNAVRLGDVSAFDRTMQTHAAAFKQQGLFNLIVRLRHRVINRGLRKISLSYSHISLRDICAKLALESVEDTEYIVAKAIHDGVIEATIDHKEGFVYSGGSLDVYSTHEPQESFRKRVTFCLSLHNDALKSMRYYEEEHEDSEDDKILREVQEDEAALAQELAEMPDEDF